MRLHRAFALLAALLSTPALRAQDIPTPAAIMAPWIQVELIVFPVSIYEPEVRRQNFGQVVNAFIRIV